MINISDLTYSKNQKNKEKHINKFVSIFNNSKPIFFITILLFGIIIYINYFSNWKITRFISKSKQTFNSLYLIILCLNLIWVYFNYSDNIANFAENKVDPQTGNLMEIDSVGNDSKVSDTPIRDGDNKPFIKKNIGIDNDFSVENNNATKKVHRNVSNLMKKMVASNQKWKCGICKKDLDYTFEVDHIIPLHKGGSNKIDNLMALDPICHKRKTLNQQYL